MRLLPWLLLTLLASCGEGERTLSEPAPSAPPEVPTTLSAEAEGWVQTMLTSEDTDARIAAHNQLAGLGKAVVPRMIEILDADSGNEGSGAWAAEVLILLGPDAAPAAEALAQQLIETTECNATTSTALGAIGKPAVPHLIRALSSAHPQSRLWAADALGKLAEHAGAAVPKLVALLDDPDEDVRAAVVFALRDLGPAAHPRATQRLLEMLGSVEETSHADIVDALAAAVPTDAVVRKRLEALAVEDPDEFVRETATKALAGE